MAEEGFLEQLEARRREMEAAEAAKEVAFISDDVSASLIVHAQAKVMRPGDALPTVSEFKNIKIAYVFGWLRNVDVAIALAGTLQLAQQRYRTKIVLAYPKRLATGDAAFLGKLGIPSPIEEPEAYLTPMSEAFQAYFTENSVAQPRWYGKDLPGKADVLAVIRDWPCAFRTSAEGRVIYVVPYNLPGQRRIEVLFDALQAAIQTHEAALPGKLPEFLVDVRLGAQEERVLSVLEDRARSYQEAAKEAADLARWKHLIGRSSGNAFVDLASDALKVILDGTDVDVDRREDVGREDFWLVSGGDNFGLVEAKGIGSGIARANINQLDGHREGNKLPATFPGLLVVNCYRNDDSLKRREEDVHPDVVSLAKAQNVVAMRSIDLYRLLGMKVDGEDAATPLVRALQEPGGGWLCVHEGAATLL